MSDNEITSLSLSSHIDDPADLSRQATASQVPVADTSASTASHRDTQAEQDVLGDDDDTPVDPRIAALRAMFPDYDDGLLQSILLSVGGDQNSAIEVLLGMSDPQYKSETQHDPVQTLSQVDLDEQLARRIMLEEQHAAQQAQQQQQPMLPYEPYMGSSRRASRPQQQPQTYSNDVNNERDTVADLQDRFGRIAETGKKTFESLFSKVKAKIQEYEKPAKPEPSNQEPQWVGVSIAPSQRWSYNNADAQQASYYDPNLSNSPSPPSPLPVVNKPLPSPVTTKGYDVDTEPTAGSAGPSRSESDPVSDVSTPRTSAGSRPIAAIDGGKLGLLPKRPVSLLKQQGAESAKEIERQDSVDDDDDNELEYTENPFEEPRN